MYSNDTESILTQKTDGILSHKPAEMGNRISNSHGVGNGFQMQEMGSLDRIELKLNLMMQMFNEQCNANNGNFSDKMVDKDPHFAEKENEESKVIDEILDVVSDNRVILGRIESKMISSEISNNLKAASPYPHSRSRKASFTKSHQNLNTRNIPISTSKSKKNLENDSSIFLNPMNSTLKPVSKSKLGVKRSKNKRRRSVSKSKSKQSIIENLIRSKEETDRRLLNLNILPSNSSGSIENQTPKKQLISTHSLQKQTKPNHRKTKFEFTHQDTVKPLKKSKNPQNKLEHVSMEIGRGVDLHNQSYRSNNIHQSHHTIDDLTSYLEKHHQQSPEDEMEALAKLTFADFLSHKKVLESSKLLKLTKIQRTRNNAGDQLIAMINEHEGYICQSNGYLYRFRLNSQLEIDEEKNIIDTSKLCIYKFIHL